MSDMDDLSNDMADINVKSVQMEDAVGDVIDINDPSVQMINFDDMDEENDEVDIDEENDDVKAAIDEAQWGDDDLEEGQAADGDEHMPPSAPVHDDSMFTFNGHKDAVYTLDICPTNENIVVSGGGDDIAYAFDISTGSTLHTFDGFKDSIVSVCFSKDGKYLAVGAMDGDVFIYNATENFKKVHSLNIEGDLECMAWHPRGHVLLCGSAEGNIWMWDCVDGICMQVMAGHSSAIRFCAFTLDGKFVLSGSDDCSTACWSPKTGRPSFHNRGHHGHEAPVLCIAQHPTQPLYVSAAEDGSVHVSSLANGKNVSKIAEAHTDSIESVAFGPANYPLLATGSVDGTVKLFDLSRNAQLRQTLKHPEPVMKVSWHPTKPVVYTVCTDGGIRAWHALTGQCIATLTGHKESILAVSINKTGTRYITGSDDKTVKVFAVDGIQV